MSVETIAAVIFILLLTALLVVKRKKIVTQKILFPLLYFSMYKTKLGLKSMDSFARRFEKPLKVISFLGFVLGFAGMALISFVLIQNLLKLLVTPSAVAGVGLVLPFKVKGAFFVPFFYWIIAIFVIAVVHEFSHGLIARAYKLPLKSSGFAFLGIILPIIPAAFVEPDEKAMKKASRVKQLSVYAAGPFSNVLLAFLVLGIMIWAVAPASNALFEPDGILITGFINESGTLYPAQEAGMHTGERITGIDDVPMFTMGNFTSVLQDRDPGDDITITTNVSSYQVRLATHPEQENRSYLGVYVAPSSKIRPGYEGSVIPPIFTWIVGLLYWLYVLNLGIGLFNLLPLGPLDGGRMLLSGLEGFLSPARARVIWRYTGTFFLFVVIANLGFAFFR